ncbi:hypothetical protein MMC18_009317 [Xylographa bjoerkii]|nr:hypothetical protein [Xylographa bjoerkii]
MSALHFLDRLISLTNPIRLLQAPLVDKSTTNTYYDATTDMYFDFITFVEFAQQNRVDFLPLTRQLALDPIGKGATAAVHQASFSAEISYAFKRLAWKHSNQGVVDDFMVYRTSLVEVMVLSTPRIRLHPNFVKLEGICWDVDPCNDTVWPILVFEKTQYGDLETFMGQTNGEKLSICDRFGLCAEIARAILVLHSCHIVHGDVKPSNVLIFDSASNRYIAKLADFGYATYFDDGARLFPMPGSAYWVAPEWHRHFTTNINGAKKMDVYSFGMLCLWLLCYSFKNSVTRNFFLSIGSEATTLVYACKLVKTISGLNEQQRSSLAKLFNLTLPVEPARRASDFSQLVDLLAPYTNFSIPVVSERLITSAILSNFGVMNSFRIERSLGQFYSADWRLRDYIVKCLKSRISGIYPDRIALHAAFELAFAYKLGFGVSRDDQLSEVYLTKAIRQKTDLEDRMDSVKETRIILAYWIGTYVQLDRQGHNKSMDHAQYYLEHQQLDKAELVCRRELRDTVSSLEAEHDVVYILRSQLISILELKGQWKEVVKLRLRQLEIASKVRDDMHIEILEGMRGLAFAYQNQGKWGKAETLETEVLKRLEKSSRQEHQMMQRTTGSLALTFQNQRRWNKAEETHKRVIENITKMSGARHMDTLISKGNLASLYRDRGKLKDAEGIEVDLIKDCIESLGSEHPLTLTCMTNMAVTYSAQKRWALAEELNLKALEIKKKVLGQEHEATVVVMYNLAADYWAQGRWTEVKELKQCIGTIKRKVLDDQHPNKVTRAIFSMVQAAEAAWLVIHIQIARIVRGAWG